MSNNTPQPIFIYFLAFWYPLFTIIFFDNILIFFYFIFFKRKKYELGNNPKMGYENIYEKE
jgi:hypothetical protein